MYVGRKGGVVTYTADRSEPGPGEGKLSSVSPTLGAGSVHGRASLRINYAVLVASRFTDLNEILPDVEMFCIL
jgi:hypothetical protein